MRSQVLFLASALLLFPSLATAEPAAASAAPLAPFFACAAATEAGTLRTEPAPTPMAGCSASRNCSRATGCYLISCNGQVSCTVQPTSVTCDGVVTNCPSFCVAPVGCTDPDGFCQCIDAGGFCIACGMANCA